MTSKSYILNNESIKSNGTDSFNITTHTLWYTANNSIGAHVIGPFLGAILAGLWQLQHGRVIAKHEE